MEDQLLAVVVNQERPDLEATRINLLRSSNSMTIELEEYENGLLMELTNATGDILENVTLIENLEYMKKKAAEINVAMVQAIETQNIIENSRQTYHPVAVRGSLLFFQIDQLWRIDHMYQYSLEAFMSIFINALQNTPNGSNPTVQARVNNVCNCVTETVYTYISRGLFERHKLIFSSLLCFSILRNSGDINRSQLDFLLRGKKKTGTIRPETVMEWCSESVWSAIQALAEVDGATPSFASLPSDLSESNRWKLWVETEKPEEEKLPSDWKNLTLFQKLLILRCLRPDRLTAALEKFVSESIGKFFIQDQVVDISISYKGSSATTPLFFILSPGVDPVRDIEELGRKYNKTYEDNTLYNVSLGQGQEVVAERALEHCFYHGGWVMLNNIHLVQAWLLKLEKILDSYTEIYTRTANTLKPSDKLQTNQNMDKTLSVNDKNIESFQKNNELESSVFNKSDFQSKQISDSLVSNKMVSSIVVETNTEINATNSDQNGTDSSFVATGSSHFRLFFSAEPSNTIPIGILQRSIKLTSEPPTGVQANILRALTNFSTEPWEKSSKPTEYRCIMFVMCFFHAVVVERKKFGPQGWNKGYPFNIGDLTTCLEVTANYIEDRSKVPWEDLRYVFGEIMYGGHIIDDWDRVLCMAYLNSWLDSECLDNKELAPGLNIPGPMSYQEYIAYIENPENMPQESPLLYGLHSNAEINYRTIQGNILFQNINELQPKQEVDTNISSPHEIVFDKITEMMEKMPELYPLADLTERLEDERTPQQHVFYQECERINMLITEIVTSLKELLEGMKGNLSMTDKMNSLFDNIYVDNVPESWKRVSFASMRSLPSWFDNMLHRNQQLMDWVNDLTTPKVTMLSYLFNPMSFLTAIMQTTAMNMAYDLDQMSLVCDVTKKSIDQVDSAAREGCHIYGLVMDGARWDVANQCIEESKPKEIYSKMPVITIRALPHTKIDRKDQYECPLYKTQNRGPGFVAGLWLRTRMPTRKWTIAGVSLLLDIVE